MWRPLLAVLARREEEQRIEAEVSGKNTLW